MKIAIADSNYKDGVTVGLSAMWLRWQLGQLGISDVPRANADYVLLTCSCPQNYKDAKRSLRDTKCGAKIILGGAAAFLPAAFDDMIDVACVGEGAAWIKTLVRDGWDAALERSNSYIPGGERSVIPDVDFTWDLPPMQTPDGITRVFASRGCRYKCLFCQTGWSTTYRCNPNPDRLRNMLNGIMRRGEKISIMTNDGAEKSVVEFAGYQSAVSMRADNLRRMIEAGRPLPKSVRIGVEGISERLRRAVGKPIQSDDLLSVTYELLARKVSVRWFFIMGLPGETDQDWAELDYLVMQAKKFPWGFAFFHFHPFMPFPATPLGILPLEDEYEPRIEDFKTRFYRGVNFTRRVQLLRHITKYKTRMRHSMANMCATEDEVRRGWMRHENSNWRIQYQASPDDLRRLALVYSKKVGVEIEK